MNKTMEGLIRARLFHANRERLQHFASRWHERGASAKEIVVCIDVDDPTWTFLVDALMPGYDWDSIRARGEKPVARGLASFEATAKTSEMIHPAAGGEFRVTLPPGQARCAIFAAGGVSVFGVDIDGVIEHDQCELHLPQKSSMQKLFGDLLDRSVTAEECIPRQPTSPGLVATYVYNNGELGALCICDLAVASHVGAALMLVLPSSSTEAVKAGKVTEAIIDNARVVLNVVASLFIHDSLARVRLKMIHPLPGNLPEEVAKAMAKPAARLDLELHVQGYGAGKIALLTV